MQLIASGSLVSVAATAAIFLVGCGPVVGGADEGSGDLESIAQGSTISPATTLNPNRSLVSQRYSCRIGIKVWRCRTTKDSAKNDVTCTVDGGYVAVGGGARTGGVYQGAYLTASFPVDYGPNAYMAWRAASKDHRISDPHTLEVFVIGMNMHGPDGIFLRESVHYAKATSSVASIPSASAQLPTGYLMLGGGASVAWTGGIGNMLYSIFTTSYGATHARSKDHGDFDPSTVTAYAIGIAPRIRSLTYEPILAAGASGHVGTGTGNAFATMRTEQGLITGVGAQANWVGAGRLLMSIGPESPETWRAISKDHEWADGGDTQIILHGLRDTQSSGCPTPIF